MTVLDSSALIHLYRIGKLNLIQKLFKKALITPDIYEEVKEGTGASEIRKACNGWISVAEPKSKDAEIISKAEDIEKADASAILLAMENETLLLSNDYALIMSARAKGVNCWWLTTFILKCIKQNVISKEEAKQTLLELVKTGMRLDNAVYASILNEIDKQ